MRSSGVTLAVVGGWLLAGGLICGSSTITRNGLDCGTGLGGVSDTGGQIRVALHGDGTRAFRVDDSACASAVSNRAVVSYAIAIAGGVLFAAGAARAVERGT